MDGLAFANACYRLPAEAAAAACSSISGVTAAGVVSCSAPSITGNTLSYVLKTEGASSSTRTVTLELQPCEPMDFQWWAPVLAAWFLAMVTVLCARMVYTKVFNRETA